MNIDHCRLICGGVKGFLFSFIFEIGTEELIMYIESRVDVSLFHGCQVIYDGIEG